MRIADAKQLLISFDRDRNKGTSVEDELFRLYAPALVGNSVVSRSSLHGRLSDWFYQYKSKLEGKGQIRRIFADALTTLANDKGTHKEVSLALKLDLHNLLQNECTISKEGKFGITISSSPELKPLEKKQVDEETERNRKVHKLSLFREPIKDAGPSPTKAQFEALFEQTDNLSKDKIEAFESFLSRRPELQALNWQEKLARLKEADTRRSECKGQELLNRPKILNDQLAKMAPGESYLYCFSSGTKSSPKDILLKLLQTQDSWYAPLLPDGLKSLLAGDSLPDPKMYVEGVIKESVNEAANMVPDISKSALGQAVTKVMQDDERKLTEGISQYLPNFITNNIDSWLKQGLLGNLMEFYPDGEIREWVLWVSQQAKLVKDKPSRDEFREKIIKKLVDIVSKPVQSGSKLVQSGIFGALSQGLSQLPPFILQLLEMEMLIDPLPLWIDFERQADGRFKLLLYAHGASLQHHRRDSLGSKTEWPYVIENVDEWKLNLQFFSRLSYFEEQFKLSTNHDLLTNDFYNGLLAYLEGEKPSATPSFRTIEKGISSEWNMLQLLLTKDGTLHDFVHYQLCYDAFFKFCKPYLTGQDRSLVLDDLDLAANLEKAIYKLQAMAKNLANHLDKGIIERLSATQMEIEIARARLRDKLNENRSVPSSSTPQALLDGIQAIVQKSGISISELTEKRALLSWALGDEVGELLDRVAAHAPEQAEQVANTHPSEIAQAIKKQPRGWLGSFYFSIYYRVAVGTIKLALLFSKYSTAGLTALAYPFAKSALSHLANSAIHYIIPDSVKQWISLVLQECQTRLVQFAGSIIVHCLLSQEAAKELVDLAKGIRKSAQYYASSVLGEHDMSFDIPANMKSYEKKPFKLSLQAGINIFGSPVVDSQKHHAINETAPDLGRVLKTDDLVKYLESCKSSLSNIPFKADKTCFLFRELERLEIPQIGNSSVWDSVANPEEVMQQLSSLAMDLCLYHCDSDKERTFICLYSLLAIMDRLARRVPNAKLDEYQINGFGILRLAKTRFAEISEPEVLERLEAVCRYFMPDIDFCRLPTDEEIKKRERECLFCYSFVDEKWFSSAELVSPLDGKIKEFEYLSKVAVDPKLDQHLKDIGARETVSKDEKISFLFDEGLYLDPKYKSFLPRAYVLLRFQVLLCNAFSQGEKFTEETKKVLERAPINQYHWQIQLTGITKILDKVVNQPVRKLIRNPLFRLLNLKDVKLRSILRGMFTAEPPSQKVFNNSLSTYFHYDRDLSQTELYESHKCYDILYDMVRSERCDLPIRAISYFCEDSVSMIVSGNGVFGLKNALFSHGVLKAQFLDSPQSIELIEAGMQELIDKSIKTSYHYTTIALLYLATQIRRNCEKYLPDKRLPFPDIDSQIESLLMRVDKAQDKMNLLCLKIVSCGLSEDKQTRDERRRSILQIVRLGSQIPYGEDQLGLLMHARRNFMFWQPAIEEALKSDLTLAKECVSLILKEKGYVVNPAGIKIFQTGKGQIHFSTEIGEAVLNLHTGWIAGLPEVSQANLKLLQERVIDVFPNAKELEPVNIGKFATPDGSSVVEYVGTENGMPKYVYKRRIDGRTFINACTLDLPIFVEPEKILWLEETPSSIKELHVYRKGVLQTKYKVIQKQDTYEILEEEVSRDVLIKVSPEAMKQELRPLLSFCADSELLLYARQTDPALHSLEMKQYKFTFFVEQDSRGKSQAILRDGPLQGFRIAKKQSCPALDCFASYLILENGKKRVVLIPDAMWTNSLLWRAMSALGPIGVLLRSYVLSSLELKNGKKLHQFELTDTGELYSDKFESNVYLTLLSLIQGNMVRAKKLCLQLEQIAKCRPIEEQELTKMIMLMSFIPTTLSQEASHIGKRLLVMLEENRLVHLKEGNQPWKEIQRPLENLLMICISFFSLKQNMTNGDPKTRLSSDQEWFLFQAAFGRMKRLAKEKIPKSKIIDLVGLESLVQNFFLPTDLSERYKELKKKFDRPDSTLFNAAKKGHNAYRTAGILPHLLGVHPIPFTWQNSIEWQGLLGDLFHANRKEYVQAIGALAVDDLLLHWQGKKIEESLPFVLENLTGADLLKNSLTYYAIARGDFGAYKQRKLKESLLLLSGGWGGKTRAMINLLYAVASDPYFFWKTKDVVEALKPLPDEEKRKLERKYCSREISKKELYPKLNAFLEEASFHITTANVAKFGLQAAQAFVSNISVGRPAKPGEVGTTPLQFVERLLPAIGVAKRYLQSYLNAPKTSIPMKVEGSNYASLSKEDALVDTFFDELHRLSFTEMSEVPTGPVVHPFDTASSTSGEYERKERVNLSLKDFYKRPDRHKTPVKLKSKEMLFQAYLNLNLAMEEYKKTLEQDRSSLLATVNRKNTSETKLTFEDLKFYFLKGDFSELSYNGLTIDLVKNLEMSIARELARHVRLQQMERAKSLFLSLADSDATSDPIIFADKVEKLSDLLKARRGYSFEKVNPRLARRYLAYEYSRNKMLWPKQAEKVAEWLANMSENACIELLMGFGKTDFGIPTADSFEADGKEIVFNIWPTSMCETNAGIISKQGQEVFGQTANLWHFSRGLKIKPKNSEAIYVVLKRAMEKGETINMTKPDAQALELLLIDKLNRSLTAQAKKQHKEDKLLTDLQLTLAAIRGLGKAFGDEAHELMNDVEELNYPVGKSSTIRKSYYKIVEECMKYFATSSRNLKHVRENNLTKITKDSWQNEVAKKMSRSEIFSCKTEEERQDFIAFVTGVSKQVPDSIAKSSHYTEISMCKGVISHLLPLALARTIDVEYGKPSRRRDAEYAIPYEGNTSPLDQASIRNPFEALVKTCVLFLHSGLSGPMLVKLAKKLHEAAERESLKTPGGITQTPSGRLFKKLFSTLDIKHVEYSSDIWKKACKDAMMNIDAIFLYVECFVLGQIKYWKENLRSDSQNFASMFKLLRFCTGTPYNNGLYHHRLKMLWDPGTIGEALHILNAKCPDDGIHLLKESSPDAVLREVLEKFFKRGSDFTALIDGGAQLKGLHNVEVARHMLAYMSQHNPDVKAIDFFHKDDNGRDILMTLEAGSQDPVPYERCNLPQFKRRAYFDQRHGFAANILQKFNGKGLMLLGPKHTFSRFLQEVFRMRGVKIFKKLMGEDVGIETLEDLERAQKEETQSIEIALTPDVQANLSPNKIPTKREIIEFTIKNEASEIEIANYRGFRQAIQDVIRRAVLDKILAASSISEMKALFKEFRSVLITRVEDDPKKLFGLIETLVSTDTVIELAKKTAMKTIDGSSYFSRSEIEEIQKSLDALVKPPMPSEVSVFTDGKENYLDLLNDLEKEVNNEVENEQENENEHENEQEVRTNNQCTRTSFKEWEWSDDFDLYSLSFRKLTKIPKQQTSQVGGKVRSFAEKIGFIKKFITEKIPPLFSLQDAASDYKTLSRALDPRLWCTNNFLPKVMRASNDEPVHFGEWNQRHLYQVLVHATEEDDGSLQIHSMGCLSQKEAAFFRRKLAASKRPNGSKMRVFLYDVRLRGIIAGDQISHSRLRNLEDFKKLEAQLKFVNGDIHYHSDILPNLSAWINEHRVSAMQDAFCDIYARRGKGHYQSSDVDVIFSQSLRTA